MSVLWLVKKKIIIWLANEIMQDFIQPYWYVLKCTSSDGWSFTSDEDLKHSFICSTIFCICHILEYFGRIRHTRLGMRNSYACTKSLMTWSTVPSNSFLWKQSNHREECLTMIFWSLNSTHLLLNQTLYHVLAQPNTCTCPHFVNKHFLC
jgi:hypothetical protein